MPSAYTQFKKILKRNVTIKQKIIHNVKYNTCNMKNPETNRIEGK